MLEVETKEYGGEGSVLVTLSDEMVGSTLSRPWNSSARCTAFVTAVENAIQFKQDKE